MAHRYGLGLAFLGLLFAACPALRVNIPPKDPTPPSLSWSVYHHGTGQRNEHSGSPTLNAKHGDRYRILLIATDPGGVKSIEINSVVGSGEVEWFCDDPAGGGFGDRKHSMLSPQTLTLTPAADGKVLSSAFVTYELDLTLACNPGWTFTSGRAFLTGRATNYHGGTTTEVLTFRISP